MGMLDLFIKDLLLGPQHIEHAAVGNKGCLQLAQSWK